MDVRPRRPVKDTITIYVSKLINMLNNSELIVDSEGIELLVAYDYEPEKEHYEEQGNAATFVPETVFTELRSVEVVIAGRGIDILPSLNKKQREAIIGKLQYAA